MLLQRQEPFMEPRLRKLAPTHLKRCSETCAMYCCARLKPGRGLSLSSESSTLTSMRLCHPAHAASTHRPVRDFCQMGFRKIRKFVPTINVDVRSNKGKPARLSAWAKVLKRRVKHIGVNLPLKRSAVVIGNGQPVRCALRRTALQLDSMCSSCAIWCAWTKSFRA